MAIVALDYSMMKQASKRANEAVKDCERYTKKIDSKVTTKIESLKLGASSNTNQASYFAKQKIRSLNNQKEKYRKYASKIEEARTFASQADSNVSRYIKKASKDFRATHDMKVNIITEFFAWVTTKLLNSTEFGRWLNQWVKDRGSWIDERKRKFKSWWELDGGKYIIKTVLAVVGTIVAVAFLVMVAWPALAAVLGGGLTWALITAAAGVVTATMAIINGVVKSIANLTAAINFKDDPGWAKRYNSYSSFAEYFRKNNFKNSFMNKLSVAIANIADVIEISAAIINVADLVHNGVRTLKSLKTEKFLNKVHFKSPSGKVTKGTIKYGIKNLLRNAAEFKKRVTTTSVSRLHTYYEEKAKIGGIYKRVKSIEKIGKFFDKVGDEGIGKSITEKITDKIKEYSTLHEYGSKIKDVVEKIKDLNENQKPAYGN